MCINGGKSSLYLLCWLLISCEFSLNQWHTVMLTSNISTCSFSEAFFESSAWKYCPNTTCKTTGKKIDFSCKNRKYIHAFLKVTFCSKYLNAVYSKQIKNKAESLARDEEKKRPNYPLNSNVNTLLWKQLFCWYSPVVFFYLVYILIDESTIKKSGVLAMCVAFFFPSHYVPEVLWMETHCTWSILAPKGKRRKTHFFTEVVAGQ